MVNEKEWLLANEAGETLIEIASFLSADIKKDGSSPSESIEEGSFASYNKVTSPIEIGLKVAFTGTDAELQSILDELLKLQEGTEKFSFVTPYQEFEGYTLSSFTYTFARENGRGALYMELTITQIKEVSMEYSNVKITSPKSAGDSSTTNTGSTSTTSPSSSQEEQVSESAAHAGKRIFGF